MKPLTLERLERQYTYSLERTHHQTFGVPAARIMQGVTHNPWTLKLSNMISAVFSLFSGALRGGSVL